MLLDTRSLGAAWVRLPAGAAVMVCNTMATHSLATDAYNERRADCETAVQMLSARLSGVRALRDVSMLDLEGFRGDLGERIYRRCRHVVTENARVLLAADALRAGDLQAFGRAMVASHASLRDDYEVSTSELDLMVGLALAVDGVFGARMTGGGFGGCAVALVRTDAVPALRTAVLAGYEAATGRTPEIYHCIASDGVRRVDRGSSA